jgi:hypothetical protein
MLSALKIAYSSVALGIALAAFSWWSFHWQVEELERKFVGKKVGDVLDFFGKNDSQLRYHDEPPGRLQAVSFTNGSWVRVFVQIEYSIEVYSIEGKWDIAKVRERPVRNIRLEKK